MKLNTKMKVRNFPFIWSIENNFTLICSVGEMVSLSVDWLRKYA